MFIRQMIPLQAGPMRKRFLTVLGAVLATLLVAAPMAMLELAAAAGGPAGDGAGPSGPAVLITEVYYFAFSGKGDEYIAVSNAGPSAEVDLSGWGLSTGASGVAFPNGTVLAPGATARVTGNASDFLADAGFLPDLETRGSRPEVGQAVPSGKWPVMGNEGGAVELRDAGGRAVDVYAWGRPHNGTGWSGPAAELLSRGVLARRARDQAGGWPDTNSSSDWPAGGAVIGRSAFLAEAFDASKVTAFVSPDSSFQAVAGELDRARSSILLSVYQLESWPLAQRLAAACRRGVAVSVLMEGAPVEGVSDQERAVARLLHDSGAAVSFLASRPGSGVPDRYAYLHAKYCVIDNATSVVSSENWKATGLPPDASFGNRGWGAVVESPGLAGYLSAVFFSDANPAMRDVIPYSPDGGTFGPPPAGFAPDVAVPKDGYRPLFPATAFGPGVRVRPVLSPDTSSSGNSSLLALIRSASRTLLVEQLSCPAEWGSGASRRQSPLLEAVVEAARRGVRVRLLLDGTYLDPADSQEENADALNYLGYVAAAEGLDLQARLAKIPGTLKLHNKGAVADGALSLVSSINWGRNSVDENREVGLILEGAGVAGYFEGVFWSDWNASAPGPKPGGGGAGGEDGGQYWTARAVALAVVLVAAAVSVVLRRARRGRRRY
jgi:cardiolipin synthase A/B